MILFAQYIFFTLGLLILSQVYNEIICRRMFKCLQLNDPDIIQMYNPLPTIICPSYFLPKLIMFTSIAFVYVMHQFQQFEKLQQEIEYMSNTKSTPELDAKKFYKFIFTAHISHVTIALKFPCVVSVTWRRGQKQSQVRERRQIQKGIVTFNQKLQLEVNMILNTTTKTFEQKKTKFTILIFSQKGNKQAGQINLDVSQLLNTKSKQLQLDKMLQKCPDKNAKMSFTLTGYMKQEISPYNITQKSQGAILAVTTIGLNYSTVQQPDFKKKKPQQNIKPAKLTLQSSSSLKAIQQILSGEPIGSQFKSDKNVPHLSKQNVSRLRLEEENKKLREQLSELQQIQVQNVSLKRRYKQASSKAESYYTKKFQQLQRQYKGNKQKTSKVQQIMRKKQELQTQMCQCKEQMGRILNFAIMSGNNEMTEDIYNIYQNCGP